MDFRGLHQQPQPLVIANVWDASSALAAQNAGYRALGTSSAAVASLLGYEDGEGMSFDELLYIVSRISAVTDLPLSVDMEAGYSDTPEGIIENLQRLEKIGVVGINIEDSHVVNGERQLDDPGVFARMLQQLSKACPAMFLNARTDAFLLEQPEALAESIRRGRLYAAHGASGLFVPCVTLPAHIARLTQEVNLPLNVMCMPGLAEFSALAASGVRRISMGNVVHAALQKQLEDVLYQVRSSQSFSDIIYHENNR